MPGARQQWLDLAVIGVQARPPTPFIGAGPFPAEGATFSWPGIITWRRHYYRVNAQLANGAWVPQVLGDFLPLGCVNLPAAYP